MHAQQTSEGTRSPCEPSCSNSWTVIDKTILMTHWSHKGLLAWGHQGVTKRGKRPAGYIRVTQQFPHVLRPYNAPGSNTPPGGQHHKGKLTPLQGTDDSWTPLGMLLGPSVVKLPQKAPMVHLKCKKFIPFEANFLHLKRTAKILETSRPHWE